MKKTLVLTTLGAVVAVFPVIGSPSVDCRSVLADGGGWPPIKSPQPGLFVADGGGWPPIKGPQPGLFVADGGGWPPIKGPQPSLLIADGDRWSPTRPSTDHTAI